MSGVANKVTAKAQMRATQMVARAKKAVSAAHTAMEEVLRKNKAANEIVNVEELEERISNLRREMFDRIVERDRYKKESEEKAMAEQMLKQELKAMQEQLEETETLYQQELENLEATHKNELEKLKLDQEELLMKGDDDDGGFLDAAESEVDRLRREMETTQQKLQLSQQRYKSTKEELFEVKQIATRAEQLLKEAQSDSSELQSTVDELVKEKRNVTVQLNVKLGEVERLLGLTGDLAVSRDSYKILSTRLLSLRKEMPEIATSDQDSTSITIPQWHVQRKAGAPKSAISGWTRGPKVMVPKYKGYSRIFIFSTFEDFFMERDLFSKHMEHELRFWALQKNVQIDFVNVWERLISQEADQIGCTRDLVSIVLEDIEHSDFVVLLLGSRYGQVINRNDLLSQMHQHRWISSLTKGNGMYASALELACIHAGFNAGQSEIPEKEHDIPTDYHGLRTVMTFIRNKNFELGVPDRLRPFFESEGSQETEFLDDLKSRLKKLGTVVNPGYADPESLVKELSQELKNKIASIHFDNDRCNATAEEVFWDSVMWQVAPSKKVPMSPIIVAHLRAISAHLADNTPFPLCITGPADCGKSALLYEAYSRAIEVWKPPDAMAVHYSCESCREHANPANWMRHICGLIKKSLNTSLEISDEDEKLFPEFKFWLETVHEAGLKLILFVDAVELWYAHDQFFDPFYFIQQKYPAKIRLVFSVKSGSAATLLESRGYPCLKMGLAERYQMEALMDHFFEEHPSCKLVDSAKEDILNTCNGEPRMLMILLEELLHIGVLHKRASMEPLDFFLQSITFQEVIEKVLIRWESEFSVVKYNPQDDRNLIREILSLILMSEDGLTETELKNILNLKCVQLSHVMNSTTTLIPPRCGYRTFCCRPVREAVEQKYLRDESLQKKYREQIAAYFEKEPNSHRRSKELLYQLMALKDWDRVLKFLVEPSIFMYYLKEKRNVLLSVWKVLQVKHDDKFPELIWKGMNQSIVIYQMVENQPPEQVSKLCIEYAQWLIEMENAGIAVSLLNKALKIEEQLEIRRQIAKVHGMLAFALGLVDAENAMESFEKAIEMQDKFHDQDGQEDLATLLCNFGLYLKRKSETNKAAIMYKRALDIFTLLYGSSHLKVASVCLRVSSAYSVLGDYDEALIYAQRALEIRKHHFNDRNPQVAECNVTVGALLLSQRQYAQGYAMLDEAVHILEEHFGPENGDVQWARSFLFFREE